jgi:hypothetical protein
MSFTRFIATLLHLRGTIPLLVPPPPPSTVLSWALKRSFCGFLTHRVTTAFSS